MTATEAKMHQILKGWEPLTAIPDAKDLADLNHPLFPMFARLYELLHAQCSRMPKRKNGEPWFIHPLNVVTNIKYAGNSDLLTHCIALMHDYIEDEIDLYQLQQGIVANQSGFSILAQRHHQVMLDLTSAVKGLCSDSQVQTLLGAVDGLTRKKSDFYLQSMARIFQFPNEEVRDRMIIAKLSDRIHNIQSIETFTEQQRLYECFKNLFILNNVKVYIKNLGDEKLFEQPQAPIAKLFTQCCKATFEAFLTICKLALEKNILQVRTMLQLAFKKFAFEMGGLWQVTTLEVEERHLLRLYQGILRKYEARMHQEWETFDSVKVDEFNYCRKFFSEYNFSEEQIRAILDYKDAYSLKEATARLLYDKEFVIAGFLTSELKQGRIKT